MTQTIAEPSAVDREKMFRATMAGATDILWELGCDDEALSVLHDVIDHAKMRREAGEDCRGDVFE